MSNRYYYRDTKADPEEDLSSDINSWRLHYNSKTTLDEYIRISFTYTSTLRTIIITEYIYIYMYIYV